MTRARLLAAARVVFESKGFPDTTVDDICREAGLAHGTFYIYFPSKEEIFYALVDAHVSNRFSRTSVPASYDGTPKQRFRYTLEEYFADILTVGAFGRITEQVATLDQRMRAHRLEIRRDFSYRIQRGIEHLQRRGLADESVPADITAEAIVSMISNFAYINVVLDPGSDLDIERVIDTLTDIWARAIGLRPIADSRGPQPPRHRQPVT